MYSTTQEITPYLHLPLSFFSALLFTGLTLNFFPSCSPTPLLLYPAAKGFTPPAVGGSSFTDRNIIGGTAAGSKCTGSGRKVRAFPCYPGARAGTRGLPTAGIVCGVGISVLSSLIPPNSSCMGGWSPSLLEFQRAPLGRPRRGPQPKGSHRIPPRSSTGPFCGVWWTRRGGKQEGSAGRMSLSLQAGEMLGGDNTPVWIRVQVVRVRFRAEAEMLFRNVLRNADSPSHLFYTWNVWSPESNKPHKTLLTSLLPFISSSEVPLIPMLLRVDPMLTDFLLLFSPAKVLNCCLGGRFRLGDVSLLCSLIFCIFKTKYCICPLNLCSDQIFPSLPRALWAHRVQQTLEIWQQAAHIFCISDAVLSSQQT